MVSDWAKYLKRLQPSEPPTPSLRGTSHIAISDVDGNSDVVYCVAERKPYGTREDKKAGGEAFTFAKASTSAKATVDEPKDKEAAARDPPSPRLRRIKGGHAAAVQGP